MPLEIKEMSISYEILTLNSQVVDQIAAGEVIERPANLLKELIENSLDAGATQVRISWDKSGQSIEVADNGQGIQKEFLKQALSRFATSKIRDTDDLWKLSTFGFRGEALASAAAVSELKIISRIASTDKAYSILSSFGSVGEVENASREIGTTIQISKLFENVPVRLKFLKTPAAETLAIKNMIKAFALKNPHVEWVALCDHELQLVYAKQSNSIQRAEEVLTVKPLYEVEKIDEGMGLKIHFSDPMNVQKTGKNLFLYAQGRLIQDKSLNVAVLEAYRSLLMHGEYPTVVVMLEVPPDQIDVNVHPAKSQVKFQDPQKVFRLVHRTLKDALAQAPWAEKIKKGEPSDYRPLEINFHSQVEQPQLAYEPLFEQTNYAERLSPALQKNLVIEEVEARNLVSDSVGFWSRLRVLSQAHLTYITAESDDAFYWIDQHAAHERVIFERLSLQVSEGSVSAQKFLFPYVFDWDAHLIEVVLSQISVFEKWGFEIERMGPGSLGVVSAPYLIKERALSAFFERVAEDIKSFGTSFQFENKLSLYLATWACHSAVRAGKPMSIDEMKSLLKEMDEFPLSTFCPHGRPVFIKKEFTQLDREFGRLQS